MYEKIEQLLLKKSVTAYRVATDLGMSPMVFSDWKYGKSKPKADKLLKIATYLEVPVEELIEKD